MEGSVTTKKKHNGPYPDPKIDKLVEMLGGEGEKRRKYGRKRLEEMIEARQNRTRKKTRVPGLTDRQMRYLGKDTLEWLMRMDPEARNLIVRLGYGMKVPPVKRATGKQRSKSVKKQSEMPEQTDRMLELASKMRRVA